MKLPAPKNISDSRSFAVFKTIFQIRLNISPKVSPPMIIFIVLFYAVLWIVFIVLSFFSTHLPGDNRFEIAACC